ncbi:hypothetical protein NDU88_008178 [Pleurodeles waltl]|uniref:Uncharacterized protein n=1 Tax=Pleurodeles waltl TaxID=8319 RepID=A0AAV7QRU4_PLEWA|nr:hypothetical protein NDU88_008178 [Pleurodeles waltl]
MPDSSDPLGKQLKPRRCGQVPEVCCGVTDCARGEREVTPGGGPGRRVGPTEIPVLRWYRAAALRSRDGNTVEQTGSAEA